MGNVPRDNDLYSFLSEGIFNMSRGEEKVMGTNSNKPENNAIPSGATCPCAVGLLQALCTSTLRWLLI